MFDILRNLMSLFKKIISLYKYNLIIYLPLANLVVDVGTRHSHQILLVKKLLLPPIPFHS